MSAGASDGKWRMRCSQFVFFFVLVIINSLGYVFYFGKSAPVAMLSTNMQMAAVEGNFNGGLSV